MPADAFGMIILPVRIILLPWEGGPATLSFQNCLFKNKVIPFSKFVYPKT
jgi:hypothetical protein